MKYFNLINYITQIKYDYLIVATGVFTNFDSVNIRYIYMNIDLKKF